MTASTIEVSAAVLRSRDGPFKIERLTLEAPRADEVLVRIVAVGVCHTDAAVRAGHLPTPLPVVLGHEGSGVVEAVGEGVTKVAPGDHVVLTFQSCGACDNCYRGRPSACAHSGLLNFAGARPDGSHALAAEGAVLNDRFFAQSSFATHALASERNVVKAPRDVPLDLLGPLGCGIQTGAGAVLNALAIGAGDSFVVFGAGAVGLSAVMAARLSGAATIVAVDLVRSRLDLALELGATHVVDGGAGDVEAALRALVPQGFNYSLDTTGLVGVIRTAVSVLGARGTCGVLGASKPGAELVLDANNLMAFSKSIRGIVEGDSVPEVFIPKLVSLFQQGRFPFDRLIRFYELEDINEAFAASEAGEVIKPVIRMPTSRVHGLASTAAS